MKNLMGALLKFQSEVRGVEKNAVNPHFKSRYADLDALLDATREPLVKAELVVTQWGEIAPNGSLVLITELFHVPSGEALESRFPLIAEKQTPQSMGSAITYYRRYAQLAILNLSQCDDDGQVASNPLPGSKQSNGAPLKPKLEVSKSVTQPTKAPVKSPIVNISIERKAAIEFANKLGFHTPETQAQGIQLFWRTARAAGWNEDHVREHLKTKYELSETKLLYQWQLSECLKHFDSNKFIPQPKPSESAVEFEESDFPYNPDDHND